MKKEISGWGILLVYLVFAIISISVGLISQYWHQIVAFLNSRGPY